MKNKTKAALVALGLLGCDQDSTVDPLKKFDTDNILVYSDCDTKDTDARMLAEKGRKYMDEDLNSKENPYGLTEFDLEEINGMLNEKMKPQAK